MSLCGNDGTCQFRRSFRNRIVGSCIRAVEQFSWLQAVWFSIVGSRLVASSSAI